MRRRGKEKKRDLEPGDEAVLQVWHALEGDRPNGVTPWKPLKELLEYLDGGEVLPASFCRWLRWIRALDHGFLRARNLYQEILHESFEEDRPTRERRQTNLAALERKALAADEKGKPFIPPENSGRPSMLGFFRK